MNALYMKCTIATEIELKKSKAGKPWIKFEIAYCEKRKTGDQTSYFTVVAFNTTASLIAKNFRQGEEVILKGKLTVNEWKDRQGEIHSEPLITLGSMDRVSPLTEAPDPAPASPNFYAPKF